MNEHNHTPLEERIPVAIQELIDCAEVHEQDKHKCSEFRIHLAASVYHALGLSLTDLGFLADTWFDIITGDTEIHEPTEVEDSEVQDSILNATEIDNLN